MRGGCIRRLTFTGLYTKWDSFTPRKYKINLIRTLTYRCYRICSSSLLLQSALDELRKLLLQNGYPQGIITFHINDIIIIIIIIIIIYLFKLTYFYLFIYFFCRREHNEPKEFLLPHLVC